MTTPRVLITGGAGFIGMHLVRTFSEHGNRVTIYDLQPPAGDPGDGVTFIRGDIFDGEALGSAVRENDAVVHLVGLADAGIAQTDPMKSFRLNVLSLQNVLEACRRSGGKKIVFPSSAAIYGITEDLPIRESFPPNPTNIYSWHKLLCEKMIQAYQKNYGVEYVILRLFNVYGRGNEGVIGIFLDKARKGELIESFGPFQYRDFIYGGDVAEAIHRSVIFDKAMNRTLNIGSGRGVQIREILEMVCRIYPNVRWVEKKTPFTVYDSIADITLARIILDFRPKDSREFLEKIIRDEMA
ncbi:MAG: NAD-dependent epimerase/dehydratase family protein [Methanomicrobiales archaeon]|jgi:UDP-glucose 4-epimerase